LVAQTFSPVKQSSPVKRLLDFGQVEKTKTDSTMANNGNIGGPPPTQAPPPQQQQVPPGQGPPRPPASLLTRVNNALQAIENNQFTLHAEQENLVQTIAGWMDEAKAQPNEFLRKSMMSSIKSIMKQMNMQFTPVQPYDDLVNRTGSKDAHGVVSKIFENCEIHRE
jgi:hypothetical protein